jgi:acyl-CoA thioesterase-2
MSEATFTELLDLLDLERAGPSQFVGASPAGRNRSLFGGQLLAQALVAAGRTVDGGKVAHSLHAYFLRPGDPTVPLELAVEAVRDGRNYQHRQVVVHQRDREVLRLVTSFVVPQPGPTYQAPTTVSEADPATFTDYVRWTVEGSTNPGHEWANEDSPAELRFEEAPASGPHGGQHALTRPQRIWMRLHGTVPSEDPLLHAALLAWLSDKTLSDCLLLAHGHRWLDDGASSVSLDHSMWFLEPARADGWLCLEQSAEATAGGRGLARGSICTADGRRIASLAQEATVGVPAG